MTQGRLQATLDFGFQAQRSASPRAEAPTTRTCATSSPATTVHRRRHQRLLAADLPRQPRHGPDRQLHAMNRATRERAAGSGPARARADVPDPWAAGRLLRRRAGLHRQRRRQTRTPGRTCSPARSPTTTTDDLLGTEPPTRGQLRHRRSALPAHRPVRRCGSSIGRSPTAPRSTATRPRRRHLCVQPHRRDRAGRVRGRANNATTAKTVIFADLRGARLQAGLGRHAPTHRLHRRQGRPAHRHGARRCRRVWRAN